MAITEKQKANLKHIKKGQVLNPEGGRAHNPELRQLKNLTEQEMVEIGSLVVKGTLEDLKKITKDPTASALTCMMAAVAIKTISTGNAQALDILLNRLVGKAKERVQITSDNRTSINADINLVKEEDVKMILAKLRADV